MNEFWTAFFESPAFLLLAMGFVLGIFNKLIEGILVFFQWLFLTCFEVLNSFEEGVILRLGKYNRTLAPGFHWILPWGIEKLTKETVVRQTAYLAVQSLFSKDGKPINIAGIVIFTIEDIKKFLLEIDEGETDVNNMVYGTISDCVEHTDWADIPSKEFNKEVLKRVRQATENYCGVKIIAIKWSDKTTARSIRLWND